MSPKEFRQTQRLRQATEKLSSASFDLYRRLLATLLKDHQRYEFLKPLSDALRSKRWKDLYAAADQLSTQKYADATSHYVANQFTLLIKKYPWEPKLLGFDPEETAWRTFRSGESRCRRINQKFDLLAKDPSRDKYRAEGKIAMAFIRSVIGWRPNLRSIWSKCEFGQGASLGIHGDATHVVRKLSDEQEYTVTPGALHYAFGGIMRNHHYLEAFLPSKNYGDDRVVFSMDYSAAFNSYVERLEIVDYNKISFVLKTAKTHRGIAVEPLMNGFVQKGIDLELRSNLLTVGIDLSDQSKNQRMAREGSLNDSDEGVVTIDLRNASNSNAIGPVKYLYPGDWFDLLDRTRSHYYEYKGVRARYEMLCSMGNGFCFPIETLTFVAICVAAGAGTPGVDFSVYGDDIIVRKAVAGRVLSLLKHYGFTANVDKTFLEGPFRESCGADWFNGEDVRPFTLDFALDSVQNVFKYLNLSRRSERTSQFFATVRTLVMRTLPDDFLFVRPFPGQAETAIDSSGDEHLYTPHCRFIPHGKEHGRWEWQELQSKPIADEARMLWWRYEPWLMGVALRGTPARPFGRLAGLPEVTYRRKTRTKVARESYASTSNWLPPPTSMAYGRLIA